STAGAISSATRGRGKKRAAQLSSACQSALPHPTLPATVAAAAVAAAIDADAELVHIDSNGSCFVALLSDADTRNLVGDILRDLVDKSASTDRQSLPQPPPGILACGVWRDADADAVVARFFRCSGGGASCVDSGLKRRDPDAWLPLPNWLAGVPRLAYRLAIPACPPDLAAALLGSRRVRLKLTGFRVSGDASLESSRHSVQGVSIADTGCDLLSLLQCWPVIVDLIERVGLSNADPVPWPDVDGVTCRLYMSSDNCYCLRLPHGLTNSAKLGQLMAAAYAGPVPPALEPSLQAFRRRLAPGQLCVCRHHLALSQNPVSQGYLRCLVKLQASSDSDVVTLTHVDSGRTIRNRPPFGEIFPPPLRSVCPEFYTAPASSVPCLAVDEPDPASLVGQNLLVHRVLSSSSAAEPPPWRVRLSAVSPRRPPNAVAASADASAADVAAAASVADSMSGYARQIPLVNRVSGRAACRLLRADRLPRLTVQLDADASAAVELAECLAKIPAPDCGTNCPAIGRDHYANGSSCLAWHDGAWARGLVRQRLISKRHWLVRLVDLGLTVAAPLSLMRPAPAKLVKLAPPLAYKCCLAGAVQRCSAAPLNSLGPAFALSTLDQESSLNNSAPPLVELFLLPDGVQPVLPLLSLTGPRCSNSSKAGLNSAEEPDFGDVASLFADYLPTAVPAGDLPDSDPDARLYLEGPNCFAAAVQAVEWTGQPDGSVSRLFLSLLPASRAEAADRLGWALAAAVDEDEAARTAEFEARLALAEAETEALADLAEEESAMVAEAEDEARVDEVEAQDEADFDELELEEDAEADAMLDALDEAEAEQFDAEQEAEADRLDADEDMDDEATGYLIDECGAESDGECEPARVGAEKQTTELVDKHRNGHASIDVSEGEEKAGTDAEEAGNDAAEDDEAASAEENVERLAKDFSDECLGAEEVGSEENAQSLGEAGVDEEACAEESAQVSEEAVDYEESDANENAQSSRETAGEDEELVAEESDRGLEEAGDDQEALMKKDDPAETNGKEASVKDEAETNCEIGSADEGWTDGDNDSPDEVSFDSFERNLRQIIKSKLKKLNKSKNWRLCQRRIFNASAKSKFEFETKSEAESELAGDEEVNQPASVSLSDPNSKSGSSVQFVRASDLALPTAAVDELCPLRPGDLCVVRYPAGSATWRRGQVLPCRPDQPVGQVRLLLVDVGIVRLLPAGDCRRVRPEIAAPAATAAAASLACLLACRPGREFLLPLARYRLAVSPVVRFRRSCRPCSGPLHRVAVHPAALQAISRPARTVYTSQQLLRLANSSAAQSRPPPVYPSTSSGFVCPAGSDEFIHPRADEFGRQFASLRKAARQLLQLNIGVQLSRPQPAGQTCLLGLRSNGFALEAYRVRLITDWTAAAPLQLLLIDLGCSVQLRDFGNWSLFVLPPHLASLAPRLAVQRPQ
ncbi:hypothetical protein BOX15_Mlig003188g1, partial [Macrostomum lignano]